MDKTLLQPLSGFRDYNRPTKDWLTAGLRQIFLQYGYQPLETPSLERQELLLKDYGAEAQKLLYLFQDNGQRPVGLRYDLTVPLARFVAANYQQLPLPYKRFEIGSSWRAERAQKGRLRQFTQADIDILGSVSLACEKEALAIIAAFERRFGVKLQLQLNDRVLITAVLDKLKVEETLRTKLLQTLDKKDKLTAEALGEELAKVGLSDVQLRQVRSLFLENESLDEIAALIGDDKTATIRELLPVAEQLGLTAAFTPSLVRGLDYYTGTLMECRFEGYPSSVLGGGRYDRLVEGLTGEKIPAFGVSFGVDRLVDIFDEQGIAAPMPLFIARLPETTEQMEPWLESLRAAGRNVDVYLDAAVELGKQIKYADKRGYKTMLIPLEAEWAQGKIVRKDLESGKQETIERADVENERD